MWMCEMWECERWRNCLAYETYRPLSGNIFPMAAAATWLPTVVTQSWGPRVSIKEF